MSASTARDNSTLEENENQFQSNALFSGGLMASDIPPTDEMKAAAMPWIVGVFTVWGVGIVSCAFLGVYLFQAQRVEPWVFATWSGGTAIGVTIATSLCGNKLERIAGQSRSSLWRRLLRNIAPIIIGEVLFWLLTR
jgi:hypothetical protein